MHITRRRFLEMGAAASAVSTAHAHETETSVKDASWTPRKFGKRPNIVIAILDDVGFGDLGCYGSELETRAIDGLAKSGLRFNNFHVTALCSPTRACLFTGRNAHAVGVGSIVEWGRPDLPGYKGWVREDATMLPEILRELGYTTSACGKWHLSTLEDQNGTGPFDLWPTGRGFDHWYGFHGSAVDHWHPEMFENTSAAYPDKPFKKGDESYHLSEDLVDGSIRYIRNHLSATPDKPFFHYLAFGATHFPLHAPSDDIRRKKGRYDEGWDALREERWARQRKMGFLPDHARLSERNENIPAFDSLTADEKVVAIRQQEVYAAFLEHTDQQIGRLVDFLKAEDQFDDTIFIVLSDNGASYGGPKVGYHDVRRASYLEESFSSKFMHYEKLGGEESQCINAPGWSHASNTPLKWYKGDTYGGGTRAPLVVSWPNGKIPAGEVRGQYTHVVDVLPTLLNMVNADVPGTIDGKPLLPIQGQSFAYAIDNVKAPTVKSIQYFETLGDRAIWADGWKAVTRHTRGESFEDDIWELYHLEEDFSETKNLAAKRPDLLKKLISLWHEEAKKYDVLPLTDETLTLFQKAVPAPRATYLFYPSMTRLDRMSAPDILKYNSELRAYISHKSPASGVILASGDSGGGYEFFMKDGYLHYVYVYVREDVWHMKSPQPVPKGDHIVGIEIRKTGEASGEAFMSIDGEVVNSMELPQMWPIYYLNSGVRCGENRHAPISFKYNQPYVFDQTLQRVVVDLAL